MTCEDHYGAVESDLKMTGSSVDNFQRGWRPHPKSYLVNEIHEDAGSVSVAEEGDFGRTRERSDRIRRYVGEGADHYGRTGVG